MYATPWRGTSQLHAGVLMEYPYPGSKPSPLVNLEAESDDMNEVPSVLPHFMSSGDGRNTRDDMFEEPTRTEIIGSRANSVCSPVGTPRSMLKLSSTRSSIVMMPL